MQLLLSVSLSIAASVPAHAPQGHDARNPVIVDSNGDVVRFYGVPMNLTPAGLKRYRYKVGHFSAEGDTYTFYTLEAEGGVRSS